MKIFIFVLALLQISTGCATKPDVESPFQSERTPVRKIIEGESKVLDETSSSAKVTRLTDKYKEDYRKVAFVDPVHGWLLGNAESMYKTSDGGRTWIKLAINIEKRSPIADFSFLNESVGWVWSQREGDVDKNDSKVRLLKTIDGGQTWQQLLEEDFSTIESCYFLDEKHGWILGRTSNPDNVYDRKQLFRSTTDGGNTWVEIGEDLARKNGFTDSRQLITGLIVESRDTLKVTMFSQKMFETLDGGKTWTQFGPLFELPQQTTLYNFGKIGRSARLRMANGTWSIEGIYSYIATENNGDWTLRWTDKPLCIYDINFISETDLVAVGKLASVPFTSSKPDSGVVVYSNDTGENLQIIYRTSDDSEIRSVAKVTDNRLIAVGEKGLILNITLHK